MANAETTEKHLQFAPFSSTFDSGFWQKLSHKKLNVYGLDEELKTIYGFYFNGHHPGMTPRMSVDYTAFDDEHKTPPRCFSSMGSLYITNTLESFKSFDKLKLLEFVGKKIWKDIYSEEILDHPNLLSRFLILTYVDLKKYNFYYWCAFPCLLLKEGITIISQSSLAQTFNKNQIRNLTCSYDEYQSDNTNFHGYFLVHVDGEEVSVGGLVQTQKLLQRGGTLYFAFADPCTLESNPGWLLRNYLILISYKWGEDLDHINVLCFRDRTQDGQREIEHSLLLTLKMPPVLLTEEQNCDVSTRRCSYVTTLEAMSDTAKCIGWEKNERSKLGPRHLNLRTLMDPLKLADSAVNLNLALMKWRLSPQLDLEKIANTSVLLLGAGTLGCNVARGLMAWGVRSITFVDNGKVSYSNPVRQWLFTFEDCLDEGRPKAEAAANALKTIYPGVHTAGLYLSIPMPGHFIPKSAISETRSCVQKLSELIDGHDVIFLLMDTRESRWLPTLMGAAKKKIVMNAALGFDTYLVLRHGHKTEEASSIEPVRLGSPIPGSQLGCYFCNDVVAPGNSMKDRTLDQQCTVTRPGISMIASAQVVELLISILQHPLGADAPANTQDRDQHQEDECCLGIVPHQIRGFLSQFHHVLPASQAFDKCTACSQMVIDSYLEDGFDFLLRAFNEPTYLEDLTGLTQMQQETMVDEVWDLTEDEEEEEEVEMTTAVRAEKKLQQRKSMAAAGAPAAGSKD